MAKKAVARYVCNNCGATSLAWSGRCGQCGEWNTMEEEVSLSDLNGRFSGKKLKTEAISVVAKHDLPRLVSGISEVDAILGGGLVNGSVSLLAGQPGIGKSTLLLQLANAIADKLPVLYISGEESPHQIAMRAKRLKANSKNLQLAVSSIADDIALSVASGQYRLVVVDSIQTLVCNSLTAAAGTISQVSGSTQLIMSAAKQSNTAVIVVGHVTKDGSIAGPKVLEHIVDVVLQMEGDNYGGFKILRASKNRFGSTTETGIFEMEETGLESVENPSAALLAERQISDGSVVLATVEGTRPLLVEVQALVNTTNFGYPKRAVSGLDLNRLNLLVAVLEKRTKLKLAGQDIYVNIVGGIRLNEPAADLAVCMAIGSAAKGLRLKENAVVFGEVGLSGEIRHVPFTERRLAEAKKMGFTTAIGPVEHDNKKYASLHGVSDVRSALNKFLEKD